MFFSNPPFLFIGCSMTLPLESEWWLLSGKVTEQRSARDADCSCHCLFVCSFGLSPIINFSSLYSPFSIPLPSFAARISPWSPHSCFCSAKSWNASCLLVGRSVGSSHLISSFLPSPFPLYLSISLPLRLSRCLSSHIVTFSFTYIRSEKSSIISLSIFIFNYFFFLYDMARKSFFWWS